MSEELKPCPFCGGESDIIKGSYIDGNKPVFFRAYCKRCQVRQYMDNDTKSAAIKAWNTRAQQPTPNDSELVELSNWLEAAKSHLNRNGDKDCAYYAIRQAEKALKPYLKGCE